MICARRHLVRGQHGDECIGADTCTGCKWREADVGQLCQRHYTQVSRRLRELVPIYEFLPYTAGSSSSALAGRVTGTKAPPLPLRVDTLNLRHRSGLVDTLLSWENDWREQRGMGMATFRGNTHQQLQGTVGWLTTNLMWAVTSHPAISDFCDEVDDVWAQAQSVAGLRRAPMKMPVPCFECGGRLIREDGTKGLSDDAVCDRCHSVYDSSRYWLAVRAHAEAS